MECTGMWKICGVCGVLAREVILTVTWCIVSPPLLCMPLCSVAVCRFANGGDDWYVLVGVARDMILNPRSVGGGYIYTYRLVGGGEKLEFVHKVSSRENNSIKPTSTWSHLCIYWVKNEIPYISFLQGHRRQTEA